MHVYRRNYFCLRSLAGPAGTYLASQNSHLNNASFYLLAGEYFSFFFIVFYKRCIFSILFCFCRSFLHIRAFCRRASDFLLYHCIAAGSTAQHIATISPHIAATQLRVDQIATTQASRQNLLYQYCSAASTAQHSAISPHKAAKQARADQRATMQASRQELVRASICRRVCIQHAEFSKRTTKSKSA